MSNTKAVVVFSGGQDSTTCLGIAIKQFGVENVHAISFIYGQKHVIELEQAARITKHFGIDLKVVDLSFFGDMVTSALTNDGDVSQAHAYKKDLPASFVPNRNALFLTLAHAHAQEVGADLIYTGVCETDYSGYPDCRLRFINQLEIALNTGYETSISIITPLMALDKAETFALAEGVGILEVVIGMSHTCYNGDRTRVHQWGCGCGECPACKLRAEGYEKFMAAKEIS